MGADKGMVRGVGAARPRWCHARPEEWVEAVRLLCGTATQDELDCAGRPPVNLLRAVDMGLLTRCRERRRGRDGRIQYPWVYRLPGARTCARRP